MNTETITILIGFLALTGGQLATLLTLLIRMDRQRKEINDRFDDVSKRFDGVNQDMSRRFDEVNKRFDAMNQDVSKRFDGVNKRFDETIREIAEQRERMARLEGSLDGFLAGRRDRDAA